MGKVLQFTSKPPAKLGFERVKQGKKSAPERRGQLNLFNALAGKILQLPSTAGPFEEALLLDERGDQRAVDSYWRAIEAGDCVADAYCNLGIFESRVGNTARAFDCFSLSLKHDPRHFESHYNLGNLYFEMGDLRLARVHYELAIEVNPAFPNAYFNLGLVHALNENFAAAIEVLSRYRELAPGPDGLKADELLGSLKLSTSTKKRV
ncbi:MAG: tetratricopeptide repeat protein [Bacteroidota bacterium]